MQNNSRNRLTAAVQPVATSLVSMAVLGIDLSERLEQANALNQELLQDVKTESGKREQVEKLALDFQTANEMLHKRALAAEKELEKLQICVRNVIDILRNPWNFFWKGRKALRYLCVADATKAFFKA